MTAGPAPEDANRPFFDMSVHKGDIPKEYKLQRFYTSADVAKHSSAHDCWVSFHGNVYDLTPLLAEYQGPLAQPIIEVAGSDISHWFDEVTGQPKTHVDPVTGLQEIYCPWGRYIHVPPQGPESGWSTKFNTPWWEDKRYFIGRASKRTRKVTILNLLTKQKNTLEVPVEETVDEIKERYLLHNAHAGSYTWKRLGKPLNMDKTLEENGMTDETEEFMRLSIDPDDHIPVIHLYFNDDLTEA
jgi:cytochrome b involved in lipid metabolism